MATVLKPLTDRAVESPYFALMREYTRTALESGVVERYWKNCALAFLLKKTLTVRAPSEVDTAMGGYLLCTDSWSMGSAVEKEFLSWSSDPAWQSIGHRNWDSFPNVPEGWWSSFGDGPTEDVPLPIEAALKAALEDSVPPPDTLSTMHTEWKQFVHAYRSL